MALAGGSPAAAFPGLPVEATAPCRIEIVGGPADGPRLVVALDRRSWCRAEAGGAGLRIQSKDARQSTEVADTALVAETSGPLARVASLLRGLGVQTGLRISTEVKVPEDAGLGGGPALSVAVLAAVAKATGRTLGPEEMVPLVRAAETGLEGVAPTSDIHCALFGGAYSEHVEGGVSAVTRLDVDPARIEECLFLVDPGLETPPASPPWPRSADVAERVASALRSGHYAEVGEILKDAYAAADAAGTPVGRVAALVDRAGGAAWASGRLVAVWAAPGSRGPGPRERVKTEIEGAGFRVFRARVDLRGLAVE